MQGSHWGCDPDAIVRSNTCQLSWNGVAIRSECISGCPGRKAVSLLRNPLGASKRQREPDSAKVGRGTRGQRGPVSWSSEAKDAWLWIAQSMITLVYEAHD
jgi:hypothetical protein